MPTLPKRVSDAKRELAKVVQKLTKVFLLKAQSTFSLEKSSVFSAECPSKTTSTPSKEWFGTQKSWACA